MVFRVNIIPCRCHTRWRLPPPKVVACRIDLPTKSNNEGCFVDRWLLNNRTRMSKYSVFFHLYPGLRLPHQSIRQWGLGRLCLTKYTDIIQRLLLCICLLDRDKPRHDHTKIRLRVSRQWLVSKHKTEIASVHMTKYHLEAHRFGDRKESEGSWTEERPEQYEDPAWGTRYVKN